MEYMDIDLVIDWWFVYELSDINEPNHPKSVYTYKDKSGKLFAYPAWDFDWGTFRSGSGYKTKKALYYPKLLQNEMYVARLKERWVLLSLSSKRYWHSLRGRQNELLH
ncbi:MAG: CotH kinase family protein [Bacteroides sp.]|nr:CotH kinase family protein [Bacteroides sp.]